MTVVQGDRVRVDSDREEVSETPSTSAIHTVSDHFRPSDSKETPPQSDSDSGNSLFLTQHFTPALRTVKRCRSSEKQAFTSDSGTDDEHEEARNKDNGEHDDLSGEPQKMLNLPPKRAKKSGKMWRHSAALPECSFLPKSSSGLSSHKIQVIANSEIGGFLKCVKKIHEKRGMHKREQSESSFHNWLEEDHESMEEENEHLISDDIRVVDTDSFIVITHKKNRQPWVPKWPYFNTDGIRSSKVRPLCVDEDEQSDGVLVASSQEESLDCLCDTPRPAQQLAPSCENVPTGGSDDGEVEGMQISGSDQASEEDEITPGPEVLAEKSSEQGKDRLEKISSLSWSSPNEDIIEDMQHELLENEEMDPDIEVSIGSRDLFKESDAVTAYYLLKEATVRDHNEDQESCVVQCDERNSVQKNTSKEDLLEKNLVAEGGSDGDDAEISEMSQCNVPPLREISSSAIDKVTQSKKDLHKKSQTDFGVTLGSPDENEQPLPDKVASPLNVDESCVRNDLITGEQADGHMETVNRIFFKNGELMFVKSKKYKKTKISESSCLKAAQDDGFSQHEEVSGHEKRKKSELDEDGEGEVNVCLEPANALPKNRANVKAFSLPSPVQDSETTSAKVAKRKRCRNVQSLLHDMEGACEEEMSQIPCPGPEGLVSEMGLSSPIANEDVIQQDSNTEMNTDNNLVHLDGFEPTCIMSDCIDTVECDDQTTSKKIQESFLEDQAKETCLEQSQAVHLTEPLNNCDTTLSTINQINCLPSKADDSVSSRKKNKRKREQVVIDSISVETGEGIQHSEPVSGMVLKENKKKKKKRKHFVESADTETDQVESTNQAETLNLLQDYEWQTTELVPKKNVKKKKKRERVVDESVAQEARHSGTVQDDAFKVIQHFEQKGIELISKKKEKKKEKSELIVKENYVGTNHAAMITQEDSLELVQEIEQQDTGLVPQKKRKKKKEKRKWIAECVADERSQVEISEQSDAFKMFQQSEHQCIELVTEKTKKKRKQICEEIEVKASQVGTTETVEVTWNTELVPEKKHKRKKKRTLLMVEEEYIVQEDHDMETTEQVEALEPEDCGQQATEIISEKNWKRKRKKNKRKEEQPVEENVHLEQAESLEVLQDFEQTTEVIPGKKLKKKRHWSKSHDTQVAHEEEAEITPRGASEHESISNEPGSLRTSNPSIPTKAMNITEERISAWADQEVSQCPPSHKCSKKKKRREKMRDNSLSCVSDDPDQKDQDDVDSCQRSTEMGNAFVGKRDRAKSSAEHLEARTVPELTAADGDKRRRNRIVQKANTTKSIPLILQSEEMNQRKDKKRRTLVVEGNETLEDINIETTEQAEAQDSEQQAPEMIPERKQKKKKKKKKKKRSESGIFI